MAIRKVKPLTNAQRGMSYLDYSLITTKKPERSLVIKLKQKAGRNNAGKITVRHRGGGAKKLYRKIDFKRSKKDIWGTISSIEYDPYRNVFISLVTYADGEKRYILRPKGVQVGHKIIASEKAEMIVGNAAPLKQMADGVFIHNLELKPGGGAKIARSAGTSCQVLGIDESQKHILVRLTSGEVRKFHPDCWATIGVLGNEDQKIVSIGKAGRKRHLGIRPTVRGSAMSPVDHPHGGGTAKAPIGMPTPKSPWGKKTRGIKTRKPKAKSNMLIVSRRKRRR